MILKKISFKIVKWVGFVIAFLLISLTILLSSLRFATPYLQSHNQQIEELTSSIIGQPVKIEKVEVGYFGFQPVIILNNAIILDVKSQKELFKLHRLLIGMDLVGSLIKRHVAVGLLVVDGAMIELYQSQDGKIHWTAFDEQSPMINVQQNQQNDQENSIIYDKLHWLFAQGKIVLNDVDVVWQPLTGKVIRLNHVKFRFMNGLIRNRILGQVNIPQKQKDSTIRFSIKFRGNILESTSLSMLRGYISINNLALDLNDLSLQSDDGNQFLAKFLSFLPQQGIIDLHLRNFNFSWNKLWEKPHTFDFLNSKLEWHKSNGDQLLLKISDFKMYNNDLQTYGAVNLSFKPGNIMPFCDLQIKFTTKMLEAFSEYFPDRVMHKSIMDWLNQAFKSGSASGVIILRGALEKFPFVNHDGNFSVNIDLSDVGFNYKTTWPMLEHLNGKLMVNGKSMDIIADDAVIADVPVYHVSAVIPDLAKAVLEVNSKVYLDSEKGLRFLSISPLKDNFGKGLAEVVLQGKMRLGLKLIIPLSYDTGASTQVLGLINLNGDALTLPNWDLYLCDLYGDLKFTEDSISGNNLEGLLFNSPITLNIDTVKDDKSSKYEVAFAGTLNIDDLQKKLDFPLNNYVQGLTNYTGALSLSSSKTDANDTLEINSMLQGVEIYASPLLKKTVNETKKLGINLSFNNNSPERNVLVNYNNQMSAALSFKKTAKKTQFVGGQIDLSGTGAKVSQNSGLFVTADLGKVDWTEWQHFLFANNEGSDVKLLKNIIKQIDIKISELQVLQQVLKSVQLSVVLDKQNWTVTIQSSNIAGNIVIPVGFPKGILSGKLQKVYLQASDSKQKKKVVSPKGLPSMDFAIDDFRYGEKMLGKVVVKADPIDTGLNLSQLQIVSTNFQLDATGKWEQVRGVTTSFLNGKCTSQNVGAAFKQLHSTESLENGDGAANFALSWSGPFYDFDLPSLNGDVSINIHKGRIVNLGSKTEAEMGLGRLLNILGLQTLPRRLSLDFSDLVKNGFSFDTLSGTFKFVKGDAFTQNAQLEGPIAQVAVTGRIGFAAKDFDMNLIVNPQLTSSLPVIATVAGGPVVGAGVWLANKVIGSQVTKAVASYTYKVKGTWVNPDIQKI